MLDLLDVDPFDLLADEEPWAGPAPVTAHQAGGHNQQSHGNDVAAPNVLGGFGVLDGAGYELEYGEVQDDGGVDLDGEVGLTARYFTNGDMHVVLDLEDGKHQVLEDMEPESMRQLAYDIEELLSVDETEFTVDSASDVVADLDSDKHGFYVAKDGSGEIRLAPGGDGGEYLELPPDLAQGFASKLLDVADSYEKFFSDDAEVTAAGSRPVWAHLKGLHDQKDHGRKKGVLSLPKGDTPSPAVKKAPAPRKKATPKVDAPKTPARKRAAPKAGTFSKLTPARAQAMQGQMLAARPWTSEHEQSLKAWTTSGFHDIRLMINNPNHEPFLGIGDRAQVKAHIRNIHDAMRPLPKPVKVFRKVDPEGVGLKRGDDPARLVGKTLQNPNFTATSVKPDAGFLGTSRPIHIEIDAPAGTPAAYLESLTETKGEVELLLDAGLPLEFTDAATRPDGVVVLKARVVL